MKLEELNVTGMTCASCSACIERVVGSLDAGYTPREVAFAPALPLPYLLAMGPMLSSVRLPLPWFLDPMQYPLHYALAQILLVIPAIVAGNRFYVVGGWALWHRAPNMDSLIAIGTASAVLYNIYSTWRIAAVIIALILLSKTRETVSKGKTSQDIKKLI